jgi:hypothetical protein
MLIDMLSSAQKESDTCQLRYVRRVGPIGCDGQHIAALWYPDSRRDAAGDPREFDWAGRESTMEPGGASPAATRLIEG